MVIKWTVNSFGGVIDKNLVLLVCLRNSNLCRSSFALMRRVVCSVSVGVLFFCKVGLILFNSLFFTGKEVYVYLDELWCPSYFLVP